MRGEKPQLGGSSARTRDSAAGQCAACTAVKPEDQGESRDPPEVLDWGLGDSVSTPRRSCFGSCRSPRREPSFTPALLSSVS